MTLFFIITAWAFLEALQDPEPPVRLVSPMILFSYFREAVEIFLMTALGGGIFAAAEMRLPGAREFLAACGLMVFYLYGRVLNRRESFIWMAYACAFFFSFETPLSQIAVRSAETAAGVSGLRMILRGIQKRRFLCSAPVFAEGIPALLMTAALTSLIFSSLFVR